MCHHHAKNSRRVRAQGHADSEFLCALVNRKTHHTVEADRRQNKCDGAEDDEERRDNAVRSENFIVEPRRRAREINWEIRVELRYGLTQRWTKGISALSWTRTNNDRAKLSGRLGAK